MWKCFYHCSKEASWLGKSPFLPERCPEASGEDIVLAEAVTDTETREIILVMSSCANKLRPIDSRLNFSFSETEKNEADASNRLSTNKNAMATNN